ncbi:AMP-binding protein, partial [Burkholderia pseudomallei]
EEGVRPGMVVGVEAAHSVEAVLGIIATIKAGAICLPVDTRLQPERLDAMIADSGCRHVLAAAGARLGRVDGKRLALDGAARDGGDAPAPAAEATP